MRSRPPERLGSNGTLQASRRVPACAGPYGFFAQNAGSWAFVSAFT